MLYLLRKILVIILIISLIFNYPLALGTLIEDTTGAEDTESLQGYPWPDTGLPENLTPHSEADPCEDYHLYAGKSLLLKKKYIEGYTVWNNYAEASSAMDERAMKLLKDRNAKGPDAELVWELYDILLDWDARDENGFSEITELTDPVLKAASLDELTDYLLTEDALVFLVNFVSMYVGTSCNDSEHYAVYINPEGLLLDDSAEYGERTEYGDMTADYNEKMFLYYAGRTGMEESEAREMLEEAYDLEEQLAEKIPTSKEMLSADYLEKSNNEMTFDDLEGLSGNFPLTDIIEASDLKYDGAYIVSEPDYLKLLNEIYTEENLEKIKSIVYINALLDLGEYTDKDAYEYELDTDNECYGTSYWFTDEEAAYDTLSMLLSEPLQRIYVESYGSAEDREKLELLCQEVIDSYREMLSDNSWASQETIDYAIEKLDAIKVRVAYPDKWTDYSALTISGDSLLEAVKDIYLFYDAIDDGRIGKKADNECWSYDINTLECNAFYVATENAIYICMGIMEEPFYYKDMTTEDLYASLAGFWVGHEISHSFDANGARFDAKGNLRDWWSKEDREKFEKRIKKMDDYLDTIIPFGNYHVNGQNIDTEMLADMTGLQCALRMAKKHDDFDYDAFFRKFGAMNASLSYYSAELSLLLYDEHPLDYLRTNVTVQQFDEFYDTYGVKEGDTMYLAPDDRLLVW